MAADNLHYYKRAGFQFVGEMNIVAPENVANAYADYLQKAIDDVLGAVEPIMVFKDHP